MTYDGRKPEPPYLGMVEAIANANDLMQHLETENTILKLRLDGIKTEAAGFITPLRSWKTTHDGFADILAIANGERDAELSAQAEDAK
jgi:hypothetical protein